MIFLERLNSPKCDFTQNRSCDIIIKFQQSQPLTSHFEIFWSRVIEDKLSAISHILQSLRALLLTIYRQVAAVIIDVLYSLHIKV